MLFSLGFGHTGWILNRPSQHILTPALLLRADDLCCFYPFQCTRIRCNLGERTWSGTSHQAKDQSIHNVSGALLHAQTQHVVQASKQTWGWWCLFNITTVSEQWQRQKDLTLSAVLLCPVSKRHREMVWGYTWNRLFILYFLKRAG